MLTKNMPKILEKLEFSKIDARNCLIDFGGYKTFKVSHCDGSQHIVNLFKRTCTCGKWQLTRIPCGLGVIAIYKDKGRLKNYVDSCYSKKTFLKCYGYHINSMLGEEIWPKLMHV